MKREFALHLVSTFILLVLIILFKRWFDFSYWPLLIGGIIGTILPDVDHLIYVYLLSPQELTSQRVNSLVEKKDINRTLQLLHETRAERKNLIFHSFYFQMIFWVLTFLVISSSGSVFGRGLVGAFALHLIIDQVIDFKELGTLDNWFSQVNIVLTKERATQYLIVSTLVLFVLLVIL